MTVVEIKKQKSQKFCPETKVDVENCNNCLQATQLNHKRKYVGKNKADTDSYEKYHKEFLRNNKPILKGQERFKIESHNVFSEETNDIALSSNYSKNVQ